MQESIRNVPTRNSSVTFSIHDRVFKTVAEVMLSLIVSSPQTSSQIPPQVTSALLPGLEAPPSPVLMETSPLQSRPPRPRPPSSEPLQRSRGGAQPMEAAGGGGCWGGCGSWGAGLWGRLRSLGRERGQACSRPSLPARRAPATSPLPHPPHPSRCPARRPFRNIGTCQLGSGAQQTRRYTWVKRAREAKTRSGQRAGFDKGSGTTDVHTKETNLDTDLQPSRTSSDRITDVGVNVKP